MLDQLLLRLLASLLQLLQGIQFLLTLQRRRQHIASTNIKHAALFDHTDPYQQVPHIPFHTAPPTNASNPCPSPMGFGENATIPDRSTPSTVTRDNRMASSIPAACPTAR